MRYIKFLPVPKFLQHNHLQRLALNKFAQDYAQTTEEEDEVKRWPSLPAGGNSSYVIPHYLVGPVNGVYIQSDGLARLYEELYSNPDPSLYNVWAQFANKYGAELIKHKNNAIKELMAAIEGRVYYTRYPASRNALMAVFETYYKNAPLAYAGEGLTEAPLPSNEFLRRYHRFSETQEDPLGGFTREWYSKKPHYWPFHAFRTGMHNPLWSNSPFAYDFTDTVVNRDLLKNGPLAQYVATHIFISPDRPHFDVDYGVNYESKTLRQELRFGHQAILVGFHDGDILPDIKWPEDEIHLVLKAHSLPENKILEIVKGGELVWQEHFGRPILPESIALRALLIEADRLEKFTLLLEHAIKHQEQFHREWRDKFLKGEIRSSLEKPDYNIKAYRDLYLRYIKAYMPELLDICIPVLVPVFLSDQTPKTGWPKDYGRKHQVLAGHIPVIIKMSDLFDKLFETPMSSYATGYDLDNNFYYLASDLIKYLRGIAAARRNYVNSRVRFYYRTYFPGINTLDDLVKELQE